jgi:pimeloyl-ACP methyl ester carboxylesterase
MTDFARRPQDASSRSATAAGAERTLTDAEFDDREVRWLRSSLTRVTDSTLRHVLDRLRSLALRRRLDRVARRYAARTGQSLHAHLLDLTARHPDLTLRRDLTVLFGLPNAATLTFDLFAEQLTVSLAYSDQDDLEDAKGVTDPRHPARLLDTFRYDAHPAVHGRWGLQMRRFTPRDDAPFRDTFVTFRGTEGVLPEPWAPVTGNKRESALDTDIGDFNRLGVGYGQYLPNVELIARQMRHAARNAPSGRAVVTGHSLGGALAQIAACRHPELVRGVLTWASPGIDTNDVRKLEAFQARHPEHRIAARHFRTTTDLVPLAGTARVPGDVLTFERYEQERPGGPWNREFDPFTALQEAHTTFPLRDLVAGTPGLPPSVRQLVEFGAVDPTTLKPPGDGGSVRTLSVLHDVATTKDDPIVSQELGRKTLLAGVFSARILKTFRANLGYNLLLEEVERRIEPLTPARIRARGQTLAQALAPLRDHIERTREVPMTANAHDLARKLGLLGPFSPLDPSEARKWDVGAFVKVNEQAREALADNIFHHWLSWHPDGENLYQKAAQ